MVVGEMAEIKFYSNNAAVKRKTMAILQSCCCWRTVRQGSFASAIYTALFFALTMFMMANFLHEERLYLSSDLENPHSPSILEPESISHTTMTISIVVLCSSTCGFATSLLLIYGLYTDKRILLIPWIFTVILATLIDLVHCVYIFIVETLRFNPLTAILFTVDFFLLTLNVYSILCVVSQYQEYRAGRGTAQYYVEHGIPSVQYTAPSTATSFLNSTTRRCMSSYAAETRGGVTEAPCSPPQSPTQPTTSLAPESVPPSRRPSTKRVQFPDSADPERRGSVLSRTAESWSSELKSPMLLLPD